LEIEIDDDHLHLKHNGGNHTVAHAEDINNKDKKYHVFKKEEDKIRYIYIDQQDTTQVFSELLVYITHTHIQ